MHLLVTGGCGYVGSAFVRSALQQGHTVTVIDSLVKGHREALPESHQKFQLLTADMADSSWVRKVKQRPDVALHFAGFIEVAESVEDPYKYFENNYEKASLWLDFVYSLGCERFVFSSTAAVYGMPKKVPIPESAELAPINPYGESKLLFENTLHDFCAAEKGASAICLRYFNAAGADLDGRNGEAHNPESHLIPRAIQAALKNEKIVVNGNDYPTPDGTCIRDYIHVEDLAGAHLKAIERIQTRSGFEAFNLGSGKGYSILQILSEIEKSSGKKLAIQWGPRREGDPAVLVADISAAKQKLGWKPKHSVDTIVSTAYNWHRDFPQGYGDE